MLFVEPNGYFYTLIIRCCLLINFEVDNMLLVIKLISMIVINIIFKFQENNMVEYRISRKYHHFAYDIAKFYVA